MGDADSAHSARRPADVFLLRWRLGPPAAWDFAVTSGLRLESIADSVRDPDAALTKYEDYKCSYQDTKSQCQSQGLTFLPMVMEAVGGGCVARPPGRRRHAPSPAQRQKTAKQIKNKGNKTKTENNDNTQTRKTTKQEIKYKEKKKT